MTIDDRHVTSPMFGLSISTEDFFYRFLNHFEGMVDSNVVIDGYTEEYLLREAYETIFGITNLEDRNNPLAIVGYTNADTLGDIGPIADLIQTYRSNDILDKYGLSIKDYFDMPVNVAKLLISNVRTEKEDMSDIMQESERKADREWRNKSR